MRLRANPSRTPVKLIHSFLSFVVRCVLFNVRAVAYFGSFPACKENPIRHSIARGGRRVVAALLLSAIATFGSAQIAPARAATAGDPEHGKYLVTNAGQCFDCHGRNFAGGPNHIPGPPGVPWAKVVPRLRGLPMFHTDAAAVKFLMTAKLENGRNALPPMPHYNFNKADATAIVAYLRSLK